VTTALDRVQCPISKKNVDTAQTTAAARNSAEFSTPLSTDQRQGELCPSWAIISGSPRVPGPNKVFASGRYEVSTSISSTVARPMRRAASRSARTGSVHHGQRDSGHGNHGCRPTTFGVFMAGSFFLLHPLEALGDRVVPLDGQVLQRRLRTGAPAGD